VIAIGTDDIVARIREIGGQLVMLDEDLADLYGVEPAELRAVVRRNKNVFGVEFAIPVPGGSGCKRKMAFTEYGVIVVGSMLGDSGIEAVSIHIVRAFVRLRESMSPRLDIAQRIEALDKVITGLEERIRGQFTAIYEALGMPSAGRRLH